MNGLSLSTRLHKQRVGKVDSGFKRKYREDTIACGAKIVQFWKLQLQDLAAK